MSGRAREIFKKLKIELTDFKSGWDALCSSDDISKEDVAYIAKINNIKHPSNMTKKEICNHVKGIDWRE